MNNKTFALFLCFYAAASCPVHAQYTGQLPSADSAPAMSHGAATAFSTAKSTVTSSKIHSNSKLPELKTDLLKSRQTEGAPADSKSSKMTEFNANSGKLEFLSTTTDSAKRAEPSSAAKLGYSFPTPAAPKGAKKGHWGNLMSMSGMPIWVEDPVK